jgi:hypothetical protein
MSQPMPLATFYDELMRHDWFYDRSDDHTVWKKGESVASHLQRVARTSSEHQALYRQIQAYQTGPRDTVKPERPAENAPFVAPPAPPSEAVLATLSEEDRVSVLGAPNPAARFQQVTRRNALDARVSIVQVLEAFGATPSPGTAMQHNHPVKWVFPDGTRAMIKVERQAWVEQNANLTTGNGATALARRLLGQPEDTVLATLESRWPVSPTAAQPPAPPKAPEATVASPQEAPVRRFRRHP